MALGSWQSFMFTVRTAVKMLKMLKTTYQTTIQVKEKGNDAGLISVPYFYVNIVGMMVF